MSHPLVSHSPDLRRLQDEGYDIEIRSDHLVVRHIPYVTAERAVAYGSLVSELTTNGSATIRPGTHVAMFTGSIPHDHQGGPLDLILHERTARQITEGLVAQCSFSSKPPEGYPDYHAKMTAYASILVGYARAIDPAATATTFPPVRTSEDTSAFRYLDSASSRAGISAITARLKAGPVAILGLGGTGSYILDLVAKTPVEEIHLYDRDIFYTHNAFRAPGAASVGELDSSPKKVDYFRSRYDPMRRNIIAHPAHVGEDNFSELKDMSFVFLAIDAGPGKRFIIEKLEEFGVPFIDTGMGVLEKQGTLRGIVRVTASADGYRRHVWDGKRISFADQEDDDYDRNIQTAELNMFNAALAVIKWKKICGFYADLEHEYSITYTIDGNHVLNEDHAE
jgi:hypothetical protein